MDEQAFWSEGINKMQAMQTPEDVQAMLKLASLVWGAKRISRELGCSRITVRNYLTQGGWKPVGWRDRTLRNCGLIWHRPSCCTRLSNTKKCLEGVMTAAKKSKAIEVAGDLEPMLTRLPLTAIAINSTRCSNKLREPI